MSCKKPKSTKSKPFIRSRTRTLKDGSTRVYLEMVKCVKVNGKWTQKFIRHLGTIPIKIGKNGRCHAKVKVVEVSGGK